MWRWLRSLVAPAGGARGSSAPEPAAVVVFDSSQIRFRNASSREQTLGWDDLGSVTIVTTDTGPFEVDLYWVLTSRDGGQSLCVPMGAMGEQDLLRELQRRLPDFDNEAVIRAMGSTASATFVAWRAGRTPRSPA